MLSDPSVLILMYGVIPLWLAVGFADWLCHRASNIETTTGAKESLIHLLMFVEVGLPLLAALFLEINALIIAFMIAAFFVHEATALWDVQYATTARTVTPIEQHVHSYLEVIPLMALVIVVSRHWEQFLALFGAGPDTARFSLAWKSEQLPAAYLTTLLLANIVFEIIPYVEELLRGLRANRGRLTPAKVEDPHPGATTGH
ncbi:MAG: diguanylate cyclase [Alphaproteobacteria bacterium]|nr:diguanylate cyclase [Alphaproteobacteria bacterium]